MHGIPIGEHNRERQRSLPVFLCALSVVPPRGVTGGEKTLMKRMMVIAVILSMTYSSVGFAAGPIVASALRAVGRADGLADQAKGPIHQRVELLGVGAAVKVTRATGDKVKGTIAAIDADSFTVVSTRGGQVHQVAYRDVTELRFTQSTYRASDAPNPAQARRVAAGLVGHHVAVQVAGRSTFRGHVQAVTSDHLVLSLDQANTPFEIPYADVETLGPNLSGAAKTGIYGALLVGALTIVLTIMEVSEENAGGSQNARLDAAIAQ